MAPCLDFTVDFWDGDFGVDVNFPGCIVDPIFNAMEDFLRALLTPAIGLPTMEGSGGSWVAFTGSTSEPWDVLIGQASSSGPGIVPSSAGMYWEVVVPVALAMLIAATALTSIRVGTMSRADAQRQFRRLGIAFLTCFFWIPVASIALRFFNALAFTIAFGGASKSTILNGFMSLVLGSLGTGGAIGLFLYFLPPSAIIVGIMLIIAMVFTLVLIIMRWILVILITVAMPIIAVFWAVDFWPMNKFSEQASKVTGVYVGLLMSGLPSAFLFRAVAEVQGVGSGGSSWGAAGVLIEAGMFFLIPVYIFKTTTVMVNMAAGAAAEVGTTGQQVVQRGARSAATGMIANDDTWPHGDDDGDGDGDGGLRSRAKSRFGGMKENIKNGDGRVGRTIGKGRGVFNEVRGARTDETFDESGFDTDMDASENDYDPDLFMNTDTSHDTGVETRDSGPHKREFNTDMDASQGDFDPDRFMNTDQSDDADSDDSDDGPVEGADGRGYY